MGKYIIKRILTAFLTILIVACLTFLLMNAIPGGPFMSEKPPSARTLAMLESMYGLDQPLGVQLVNYLKHAAQGNFGVSYRMQKNRPVMDIILEMFPVSAKLGLVSVLVAIALGIPMGCLAAYRKGKLTDNLLRVVNTIGISIPSFVLATLLLVIFSAQFNLLPVLGLDSWKHYIMPVTALAFYPMCYIARLTRSSMLDIVNQDYIRTAVAKGVRPGKLIFKHTLRNALIPVITYIGPLLAYMMTGMFVIESVFTIPGLGRYFVTSITSRDYPLIMGTTIFLSALIVILNLIVDIAYKVVDPRIKFGKGGE
jgi:oligopeptide transport system permease protein